MTIIISGPGGVGKGTVVARLLQLDPKLQLSRSWTTRDRRPGEAGDSYVFVDRDTFMAHVQAGGFLEWTEFAGTGHLYGTPVPARVDGDLLLEIELDGAHQVKKLDPEALLIMVVAPSRAVQEERLRKRGDDERSIARRLVVGEREQEEGTRLADHVVVNDDIERAAREVADIIDRRRGVSGRP